ncbi:MAG: Rieske (2Fe-2S) protein [Pseudonocardia sp.]|nr:Rieske (2Fe-2S) protein [Pseudonocardia sp.]
MPGLSTDQLSRRGVLVTGLTASAALLASCSTYSSSSGSNSASSGAEQSSNTTSAPSSAKSPAPGTKASGIALGPTSEVPVGGGKVFSAQKVVVTQPQAGTFKGFSAICTHEGCTVNNVSGGTINCPCHGSKFNIADGSVAHGPAARPLATKHVTAEGDTLTLT